MSEQRDAQAMRLIRQHGIAVEPVFDGGRVAWWEAGSGDIWRADDPTEAVFAAAGLHATGAERARSPIPGSSRHD